jgi:NDP-sugar pyrophosphorylase family protein
MALNYKVLITTSGIGSRLGEFTKFTNKSLLRVGKKPVISHIIESYPLDIEIVITLGYFGKQVKDFLNIAYPKRVFTFIDVDNFNGEGSSLLYSMLCAKHELQCPFIFHASDTIVLDNIPTPSYNWNGGFSGKGSSQYTSFDKRGANVVSFFDKGHLNPDLLHIGIVGIYDFEIFWKLASDTIVDLNHTNQLSDVDVLKRFIKSHEIKVQHFNTWFDIGNVEKMKEAKDYFNDESFHVLDKVKESVYYVDDYVIKFFSEEKIAKNRVTRTKYIPSAVPKIVDSAGSFYKYEYVEGKLFSEIANRSNFHELLKWAQANLWKDVSSFSFKEFNSITRKFYFDKTIERVTQFLDERGIDDSDNFINGEYVPTVNKLLSMIDFDWLCNSTPKTFHGDFILDNVIQISKDEFKLIDWRQDFGGQLEAGDQYYDLAKLAHNLVVNHGIIDADEFQVLIGSENIITLNIHRLQSLVDAENIYFKYLNDTNFDINKVKILRSIIWLNMSPLHHHPFDLFLFYFGKYSLSGQLKMMGYEI